jgi:sugar phosphate isomerase/epimerase
MKNIGLQMYSLRNHAQKDLIGAMKEAARIGVEGVEFAGYFGHGAKELKRALSDLGLAPAGSHIGWDSISNDLGKVVDFSLELGEPYIICPWLPPEMAGSRSAWLATAEKFNAVGEKVAAAGLKFAYHNHSFEFEEFGGETGLDILFGNVDPRYVRMELDTCWCDVTGRAKSVDVMRRHAAHLELLHIKEITAIGDPTAKAVGSGAMDFKSICALGKELGVAWFTIEHEGEDEESALGDIAKGVKYLEGIL